MLTPKVICLVTLPSAHGSRSQVPAGQRRVERREALTSTPSSPAALSTAALMRSPAAKLAPWTARS